MRPSTLLPVLCAGCFYQPGSYRALGTPFVGKRVELACLDLAVAQTEDAEALGRVVSYSFGNRCWHEISVDLASIRAVGRYADGVRVLHPYDPHHELRPLQLDALWKGNEEIEYLAEDGSVPSEMCVDVGGVDRTGDRQETWVCFGGWSHAEMTYAKPAPPTPTGWPMPAAPDAAVTLMPASAQASVASVGAYLAARITDQRRLVKALHDYVVLHLIYDEHAKQLIDLEACPLCRNASLLAPPSQDADAVFERKRGVCAGYANLMVALGKAAGVEVVYITGVSRDPEEQTEDQIERNRHAWNAAKVDGKWQLIDATWDATTDPANPVDSTYLFTPPALFASRHLPDDATWQLLPSPLGLADFVRQPIVSFRGAR